MNRDSYIPGTILPEDLVGAVIVEVDDEYGFDELVVRLTDGRVAQLLARAWGGEPVIDIEKVATNGPV